jgi:hypothetical protein
MSYKSLKGFNSIYETDDLTLIQQNLIMFFDWGFLNKGAFSDVRISANDIRGTSRSTLAKVTDPNFTAGQVWSTFHKNLVSESGLSWSQQPIQISGVYINSSLKTSTTTGYEHYVDYINGQVVFNSALAGTPTVKMEYSYKTLNIVPAEGYPITQALQADTFSNTTLSKSSGSWSILEQSKAQLPTIAVECTNRSKFRPVELGNITQWMDTDVVLHVFANTPQEVRKLINYVAMQKDKTIYMVDIDLAVRSGVMPLDYRGAINARGRTYDYLVDN